MKFKNIGFCFCLTSWVGFILNSSALADEACKGKKMKIRVQKDSCSITCLKGHVEVPSEVQDFSITFVLHSFVGDEKLIAGAGKAKQTLKIDQNGNFELPFIKTKNQVVHPEIEQKTGYCSLMVSTRANRGIDFFYWHSSDPDRPNLKNLPNPLELEVYKASSPYEEGFWTTRLKN